MYVFVARAQRGKNNKENASELTRRYGTTEADIQPHKLASVS